MTSAVKCTYYQVVCLEWDYLGLQEHKKGLIVYFAELVLLCWNFSHYEEIKPSNTTLGISRLKWGSLLSLWHFPIHCLILQPQYLETSHRLEEAQNSNGPAQVKSLIFFVQSYGSVSTNKCFFYKSVWKSNISNEYFVFWQL